MNFKLERSKDVLILVSGDKDLVPPVEQLRWGFDVTVAYWEHAAAELKAAATKFVPLDGDLHRLTIDKRTQR